MSMLLLATVIFLSATSMAQTSSRAPSADLAAPSAPNSATISALPSIPKGRSTVMGGEIRDIDPVRDQFTLKVFGGRPVKILFDERTQVYRNGVKVPVIDLRPEDHASVETMLDGTRVFASRIHALSLVPSDQVRGQVSSYNPRTGDLTIRSDASHEPMTMHVSAGTPVTTVSQDGSSSPQQGAIDFTPGSVVDVTFKGGTDGRAVATSVSIRAIPGATFVFAGKLSVLDLHSGRLVVVDPRDDQSYPIVFDSSLISVARTLHVGSAVKVTASFDGKQYAASQIMME